MKRSSKELPSDPNQLEAEIARLLTEDQPKQTEAVTSYLSAIGRKGGLKGGKARAKKLKPERRQAIAIDAAKERWKNHAKKSLP
jgi:pyruvate/2-oxoglutarate dehydrogenase complex dihydrolipoamide dehydrogenase (E3) component